MSSHISLTLLLVSAVTAAETPKVAPGQAKPGVAGEWQSADGLVYQYRLPAGFDASRGACLTFILHGSNLDRRWGFANHSPETFRPDDIVVSPDGTTSNGSGGFNSLQNQKDLQRLHALHQELLATWKVRATYLYGHSQGSFFAFYYAGAYPELVQGVVGHASGVWIGTEQGKKQHHQAIVLMHGTQDPVVPYGQSIGGFESFRKAKYPHARLRTLEGWNHWPAEHNGPVPHTSRELAWCEAMTTADRTRQAACLELLLDVKEPAEHDYAGVYALAVHLEADEQAPDPLRARARKAKVAIEKLAAAHVEALGPPRKLAFAKEPWIYHLPVFLRQFDGVPARETLQKALGKAIQKNCDDGLAALKAYYQDLNSGKDADAFTAGVQAMTTGFLYYECHDRGFREKMAELRKGAETLKLDRKAVAQYDLVGPVFDEMIKEGWDAYQKVCRREGKDL